MAQRNIDEAREILIALGLPRAQQNDRSALTLLAMLNMQPGMRWAEAEAPLIGITPIMNWIQQYYQREYAPNTRETIRCQTIHQFVAAGIVLYNPDDPQRAVNSPKTVYQIEPEVLRLLRSYGTLDWQENLGSYLAEWETLAEQYAKAREQQLVSVTTAPGQEITLSPGDHSELIRAIVEEFAPRFAPGSRLIYVGDTGNKWGYFDASVAQELGIDVDSHGKMPDVVLYFAQMNWLLLVEAVTSHGPVDAKRHAELTTLFAHVTVGIVFITAFPDRVTMARYLGEIAWETEVWVAEAPSHMIHFDGKRFLGPYTGA